MSEDELVISQVRGDLAQKVIQGELAAFNSDCPKLRILCSCQVFREGVTLERCDLTVYADGKRSRRDIIQSSMRGLKAEKGYPEKRLRILLLVHLDGLCFGDDTGAEKVSESIVSALRDRDDKMETTATVIEALKAEDDSLAEDICRLAQRSIAKEEKSDGDEPSPKRARKEEFEEESTKETFLGRPRQRLTMEVSPELLWTIRDETTLEDIQSYVGRSVGIQLLNLSRTDCVRWKVRVLCELSKDSREVPGRNNIEVPVNLQKEAPLRNGLTLEKAKIFNAGQFLGGIYHNWSNDGKKPDTKLQIADKVCIEKLPWFENWRAGDYAVVRWKVGLLCELCNNNQEVPTRSGNKFTVPLHLQEKAPLRNGLTCEGTKSFNAGAFLEGIYHNWSDGKKPHTKLDDDDKKCVEALSWFENWQKRRKRFSEQKSPSFVKEDSITKKARRVITNDKKSLLFIDADAAAALQNLSSALKDEAIEIDEEGRPASEAAKETLAARGYDAATFTEIHRSWKNIVMERFLELLVHKEDKVLYLDHWAVDKKDGRLRTTDTLLDLGWPPSNCFCPNPCPEIVSALKERDVNTVELKFAEALDGPWTGGEEYAFDAVYADFCYGSAENICDDLEVLFKNCKRRLPRVVAYTITRRGESMFHERLNRVNGFLGRKGYRWLGKETLEPEQLTFAPSGVVTTFCVYNDEERET
jgi:hypothetical protein